MADTSNRSEAFLARAAAEATSASGLIQLIELESNLCERPATAHPIVDFGQMIIGADLLTGRPAFQAIFVRHIRSLHWCGYTGVQRELWDKYGDEIRSSPFQRITHVGESSKYITWRQRTAIGKLTVPVPFEPDLLWIGFDQMNVHGGNLESHVPIREITIQFGIIIHTLLRESKLRDMAS